MIKRPLVNNQIKAKEVRVIDENGKQIGIFELEKALQIARERNLDLIQVTEKVEPPVCKIMDFGKYLYWLQKKEKEVKKTSQLKIIRFGFKISLHDLEIKASQAEKFLKKGDRIKVEIILRGREREFFDLAKEKLKNFLEILEKKSPIKIEGEIKKETKGLTIIIGKK